MSASFRYVLRGSLLAAFAAAVGLALAGTARADEIDEYRAGQAIKAQKALREIQVLLAEARKVQAENPARLRALLQQAREQLGKAEGLSARERAALTRQITTALRSAEAAVREREAEARTSGELDSVKKREETRRRELEAKRKDNGSHARAEEMIKTGKSALSAYDQLRRQRERGVLAVDRDVLESATDNTPRPPSKALHDWQNRYRPRGMKLSPKEVGLVRMLNSTLSVNFDKMTLKDAIAYLQEKTDINIFVDENSLKDASVEYDDPITFKASGAQVRTILKAVLADKGLTFIIKEACLHVMTPEKAKQFMITRTYPIQDLLPTPNPNLPPSVHRVQAILGARELMSLIVTTMDPPSWQANGGAGTINYNPTSGSLIIRQSAEFHYQLGGYLK
jgi:hypothetical protein